MKAARKQVVRWTPSGATRVTDELAREEPLEIRIETRPWLVTMRTPGNDDELAAGLLLSEGIIRSADQLMGIKANPRNRSGNSVDVFLSPDTKVDTAQFNRRHLSASSCGLCGKESIRSVTQRFKPLHSRTKVNASLLAELPERLRAAQPTFAQTGGLHGAGVFTLEGKLVVAREDIGRHNAVDKVIGHGLLNRALPFNEHILVVSGRASFEIMQKALAARFPFICAVSAPSSLAVEFARTNRQTLVGFVRESRMNIYAGRQRVICD